MTRSGRLDIVAVALDQIHHGAGSSGNTQLLRTQDVVLPDGSEARVPFISGNSLKHQIRTSGVRFALEAMGVKPGSMSKSVVDMLFSGGHLSKGGSSVDLTKARILGELFPVLSMCGYSAGNFMQSSKLRINNLHLVCAENEWRLPAECKELPAASKRAGLFRSENFGTRHEATRSPTVAALLTDGSKEKQELAVSKRKPKEEKQSSQMIYEFEVIKPGSVFFGAYNFEDLTDGEFAAFRSALSHGCAGAGNNGGLIYTVGAKSSIGLGRMEFSFRGLMRNAIEVPGYTAQQSLIPSQDGPGDKSMTDYVKHLRERSEEILEALEGAA